MVRQPAVVADISGTNARFALVDLATLAISDPVVFPSLILMRRSSLLQRYIKAVSVRPKLAAFAVGRVCSCWSDRQRHHLCYDSGLGDEQK